MDFKYYFEEQIKKHPAVRPQDVAKMCYQAAMGAEHLLADISAAKRYFYYEYDSVEIRDGELYECLSDEICRVDLGVWKAKGLNGESLFEAFADTASVGCNGKEKLSEYLLAASEYIKENEERLAFSQAEWREFEEKYRAMGMPAVHHSEEYRKNERPSYRIVLRKLVNV